jgi:hypothetical protein
MGIDGLLRNVLFHTTDKSDFLEKSDFFDLCAVGRVTQFARAFKRTDKKT